MIFTSFTGVSDVWCAFAVCLLWCFAGHFAGAFVVVCGRVKREGLPQLSPQAALGFDLLFNCSELDITHTPNLAKIF